MNRKDLEAAKAAGQHVAYFRYEGYGQEVEILETGLSRRVYSGARWDFSGHTSSRPDGVKIRFVDRPTKDEEVVAAKSLKMLWDEWAAAEDAKRNRETRRGSKLQQSKLDAEAQAKILKDRFVEQLGAEPAYGEITVENNGYRAGNHWIEATSYFVRVTPRVLKVVLAQ
jgi:hypothetical protein